ncbi:MAG: hypothetical protein ACK475_00190, partial [Bacteroidota bacterium]
TANLNGNTNIGNGDGDVVTVNTGAAADLTVAETGLTRSGDVAINPGAGNTVTTNGSLSVSQNAAVTGTTNLNGAANIGNGDADAITINTTGNFSLASSNLNISTAGTITDAGTDNGGAVFVDDLLTVSGATTIDNNLTVTGQVRGAGVERLNSAAASNKYAERVRINGDGNFKSSSTNSQFNANSVVIITVEDYTGPGILSHQIKRPKDGGGNIVPGTIDVYFSQPLLGGETVVVNVMVVNQ